MSKWAKIFDGVVDTIAMQRPTDKETGEPEDGWTEVTDDVFPGFADNGDKTFQAPPSSIPAHKVKAEAERRIEAGTEINGGQFKTDDATMIRLRGLLDAFDAGMVPAEGVTYMTAAGDQLTFADKATVQAVYDAANLFRSNVLEKSSTLQAMTEIPADYVDDSRWP